MASIHKQLTLPIATMLVVFVVAILGSPIGMASSVNGQEKASSALEFAPVGDGTELLPGGTYVIALHATGEFNKPNASVRIVSEGPAVVESIDGQGYDNTSIDGRIAEASSDELRPAGTSVFVSIQIPESTSVDSVVVSASIQDKNRVAVGRQSYSIVGNDKISSTDTLAEQARARAQVASSYADMYELLISDGEQFQAEIRASFIQGVTTVGVEAAKGAVIGKSQALTAVDQAMTLAGVAESGKLPSGLIGEVAPLFDTMTRDFVNEPQKDEIVRQNNVGSSYRQLARLYKAEATAWENNNRTRAQRIIQDERRVLCEKRGNYLHTLGERANKICEESSLSTSAFEEGSAARGYYEMVLDYKRNQPQYISGYLQNYSAAPEPSVETSRSTDSLSEQLRNLRVGESMTLSITARNGENAGLVERGYVSVSYSNNLRVTAADVSEVNPDDADDELQTSKSRPGDKISGPGVDKAKYPLVDLFEAYRPGESNTYEITVTRSESGDAWINYRVAFLPMVHSKDFQKEFVRAPSEGTTDQQGYTVVEIAADSQTTPKQGQDRDGSTPDDQATPDQTPEADDGTPVDGSSVPDETPAGNEESTTDGPSLEELPGGDRDPDRTAGVSSDGELLANPKFANSLDDWNVTYNDPPNQERGRASWTSADGGAAQLSVSGAPSNIIIYQSVNQRIPAGTTLKINVVTGGSLDCCGGVTLRLDGEGAAHLRHPDDGQHQLTYTTEQSYTVGTRIGIRTAIWPGEGEARVTEVAWEFGETDGASGSGNDAAPNELTPGPDDGNGTPRSGDSDAPQSDGAPPDGEATTTGPTETQQAEGSNNGVIQALADLLREIADALG